MPTTAKLFSALWFAALAWLCANAHVPAIPQTQTIGSFREIAASIGFIVGWVSMNHDLGRGYTDAISGGLKTGIFILLCAMLGFGGWQMLQNAMRGFYKGPMDAMFGWIELMGAYGYSALTIGVFGLLILGGILGGVLAEAINRRWR